MTGDRRDQGANDLPAAALATLLTAAGGLHLALPDPFAGIVPRALGDPRPWVCASGVAELVCAVGLIVRRTRRLAGWGTVLLFVAVFPANVQMALDSGDRSVAYRALTYARLPVQIPLILWAARVARRPHGDDNHRSQQTGHGRADPT